MARERKYFRTRPERAYTYAATLAIDWGSEAVRAKLYFDVGNGHPVDKLVQHIPYANDMFLARNEVKRQFTSHIYPFDNPIPNPPPEMVYPENNRIPDRRSISSKLAMYAVVGISDEVARQSPELRELRGRVQQNPALKQTIRLGIQQMMHCVLKKVYYLLEAAPAPLSRNLDAIALTIPAQWTIEFEEEYGELLTTAWEKIFHCEAPQLIFLNEGQTNVHYAFYRDTFPASSDRQHLSQQDFFDIGKSKNSVLLIDAGGHSNNTSLVTICSDNNQLEIRPDRGVIGGTALWAWHVLQLAKSAWAKDGERGTRPMPIEVENEILKHFYFQLGGLTDDTGAQFNINVGNPPIIFRHCINPQDLVKAFEDANSHAFALIEEGILELKSLQRECEKIQVVIGGGSAQGPMWMARMMAICKKHEIEQPVYLWQIDQEYEYARLAAGANYALAKAKSVAQFVDKAAFGLAVKKRFRGADGWTHDWHYRANMLWARGNKWAKTITTDGTEEFKIICQPEYDNPRPKSFIEPNYKAYDLLPIKCSKKGTLQFDFEIDTETDKLKLKIKHRGLLKSGKTGRSAEIGEVEFDLWVPPGSRCLQIWDCVEEIESKVAAAFSEQQEPAGDNNSEGDGADEMEVDSAAEAEPVQQARTRGRRALRSLGHSSLQGLGAAADVDMDDAAPKEEDQDSGGKLFDATPPVPQAQAGAAQASVEDVEMGGMDEHGEAAGSITVAPMPEEPPQPPRRGSQVARRRSRRGSRVPEGIFAL